MSKTLTTGSEKEKQRNKISDDIQAFLNKGGEIKVIARNQEKSFVGKVNK